MLDYRLLEALAVVVKEQGFEKAARVLHVSQPAVSQRIKLLEENMGQALLIRGNPVSPTLAGQKLLCHYEQVRLLEEETIKGITPDLSEGPAKISLGVHADSLATWLLEALAPIAKTQRVLFDLVMDDQEQTHVLLKRGEVVACIGTHETPIQGGRSDFLGVMRYILVATPDFAKRWFPHGVTKTALRVAPAVIFNNKDELHSRFLEKFFDLGPGDFPFHVMPSSEAFVEAAHRGMAYTLVPELQVKTQLADGSLTQIASPYCLELRLYWLTWGLQVQIVQNISQEILRYAHQILPQE